MKAIVAYHTLYGNTERVARALEAGLKRAGVEAVSTNVNEVVSASLNQYDLICVGGPTHNRTASEAMRSFLDSLANVSLDGKAALAFDTRRDSRLAGSAAGYIEHSLKKRGLRIVGQAQSAIMLEPEPERRMEDFHDKEEWKEWRHRNERLREGEEGRFEQIGVQIGQSLVQGALART